MDTTLSAQPIVKADVVPAESPDANAAQVLIDLENLIKSHVTSIEQQKTELKKQKEMLDSALQNDETYREHDKLAKEAAKVKQKTKYEIMQQPANKQLAQKVKDIAIEVKEKGNALSDYLREFQRMSGVNEIETDDGEVREIVYTAKLVKKSARFGK